MKLCSNRRSSFNSRSTWDPLFSENQSLPWSTNLQLNSRRLMEHRLCLCFHSFYSSSPYSVSTLTNNTSDALKSFNPRGRDTRANCDLVYHLFFLYRHLVRRQTNGISFISVVPDYSDPARSDYGRTWIDKDKFIWQGGSWSAGDWTNGGWRKRRGCFQWEHTEAIRNAEELRELIEIQWKLKRKKQIPESDCYFEYQ